MPEENWKSIIQRNLEQIKIPKNVTLVAVSKRKPAESIRAAYECGIRHFGENYLQDAVPKIQDLRDLTDIKWNFIGHIQSNKVKDIVSHFDMVQSVDRKKILPKMQKACEAQNKTISVLIQINIGKEPQKSGILPEDLGDFLGEVEKYSRISVEGLMCIPPAKEDPKPYFQEMFQLYSRYKTEFGWKHLSMGMSQDYQIGIENGATMVRIGTAIFGPRE